MLKLTNSHLEMLNKVEITYNESESRPSVSGSDLEDVYYLTTFHFHWGHNEFQGSEHTFNNRKFPLEVTIITISIRRSLYFK